MTLLITLAQLGLWLLLAAASLHLLRAARFAWSRPLATDDDDGLAAAAGLADDALPVVTVQLPLRNEGEVAARVLRAACALDWPRDRLEIQVLDDSSDAASRAVVDAAAAEQRAAGHDVAVVRRPERRGFKAGALQFGLARARGDLIAVLDADARPPRDFLRRLVPALLEDERLGFAQARWSFDDERSRLLVRVQALILHGLMLVEQPRLVAYGEPLQFNGTAGVWRRAALDAAGGWLRGDGDGGLTEDLDVSYRARLAGWRGLMLPEVAVETELPASMGAFRQQQMRWVRGAGEVLRALGRRAASGTMLAHLLRHARQPYLVLLTAWLPFTVLGVVRPACTPALAWPLVLALVWLAIGSYYGAALRRLGRPARDGFVLAPVVMALSLGLSLCLTRAFVAGLGARRREFVRTPKRGDGARAAEPAALDRWAWLEAAVGMVYLGLAAVMAARGQYGAAVVLAGLFGGGYLWVGLGSLRDR